MTHTSVLGRRRDWNPADRQTRRPYSPLNQHQAYGYILAILGLILNLLIVWFIFTHSYPILPFLKEGGTKGVGKVFALLLAAFAMMMIRTGIVEWMQLP